MLESAGVGASNYHNTLEVLKHIIGLHGCIHLHGHSYIDPLKFGTWPLVWDTMVILSNAKWLLNIAVKRSVSNRVKVASSPGSSQFLMLRAEKRESLGGEIT